MMLQMTAGLSIGVLSLHYWQSLPDYKWFITAMIIGGAIFFCLRINLFLAIAIGGLWAWVTAVDYSKAVNSLPHERGNITIVGEVRSLINHNILDKRFIFVAESVKERDLLRKDAIRLLLDWPAVTHLKQGQRYRLDIRVRRPNGRANIAGFDAERYAVGNSIHGTGTVIAGTLLSQNGKMSLRQRWFDSAVQQTDGFTYRAYLLALGFGERDGLDQDDWSILRDSGLAHLMAISGLHIGLVVVMGWGIGSRVRGALPESGHWLWLPFWLALLLAYGYAWLAGFSLPTQRALLTSVLCLLMIRCGVVWSGLQLWSVILACCLILNPLASYSAGLWLSFGAVLVLYLANTGGIRRRKQAELVGMPWRETVRVYVLLQLALLGLMLPLQWFWFGGISLAAPLINLLAVPWVSLVTVPCVLIAVVTIAVPGLSGVFWQLADWSLHPVIALASLAEGAWWPLSESLFIVLLAMVTGIVLCWFLPWRRFLCLQLSLVLALWGLSHWNKSQSLDPDSWQVDMLDVGHGLAILIQRQGRAVLYDTGNSWPGGSMALSVIEPVLRRQGIRHLDGFILSHADADHAGGTPDVITRLNPAWLRSSDKREGFAPCVRGRLWRWQGLTFKVLWPPKRVNKAANPHSCVIQVNDQRLNPESETSLLLTGDIDAISELLLARLEPDLKADILLVPHHGSNSSSTQTWLDSLQATYALVSAGKYSPWSLPAEQVKQRYLMQGLHWLETAEDGQISLRIKQGQVTLSRYRKESRLHWYQPLFRP